MQVPDGGLEKVPVSVKEGLEYYHTMTWPSNSDYVALTEISRLTKVPFAANVRSYTGLCREPLKIALYFEKKIGCARSYPSVLAARRTAAWVAKYEFFLRLPIHDIFLSLMDPRYKVIEYCENGAMSVVCLNCPLMRCRGCARIRRSTTASADDKKTMKVILRVKKFSSGSSSFTFSEGNPPAGKENHPFYAFVFSWNCR